MSYTYSTIDSSNNVKSMKNNNEKVVRIQNKNKQKTF